MSDRRLPNEEQFRNQRIDIVDVFDVKEAFAETGPGQEQKAFDNSTVVLNVGGHYFTTSIETLTKDPNSLLAAMFSEGPQKKKPSKDGSFFIDRDGTHFTYILNYLRDGELVLPENETFLKELKAEAKFYQIQGIVDELPERDFEYAIYVSEPTRTLNKRFEEPEIQTNHDEHRSCLPLGGICRRLFQTRVSPTSFSVGASLDDFAAQRFHPRCDKGPVVVKSFQGSHGNEEQPTVFKSFQESKKNKAATVDKSFQESKILTNDEHLSVLKGWLPPGGTWLLLFRATRDGFAAETFHSRCDNKGPTVTIVKSANNIFGGFTENSWTSGEGYRYCEDAFLFSMVNPCDLGPTKIALRVGLSSNYHGCAMYCKSSYGPTFGGGYYHDLHIPDNANIKISTISVLGGTYERPREQQNTFFTGVTKAIITDYEVFGLQT